MRLQRVPFLVVPEHCTAALRVDGEAVLSVGSSDDEGAVRAADLVVCVSGLHTLHGSYPRARASARPMLMEDLRK